MQSSLLDHEILAPRCLPSLSTRHKRPVCHQPRVQRCSSKPNGSKKRKMTFSSRSSALDEIAVAEKEDFTWKGSDEFSELGDRSEALECCDIFRYRCDALYLSLCQDVLLNLQAGQSSLAPPSHQVAQADGPCQTRSEYMECRRKNTGEHRLCHLDKEGRSTSRHNPGNGAFHHLYICLAKEDVCCLAACTPVVSVPKLRQQSN